MKTPLISVIIPNYNHAPFLKQRIESVINQTYSNIEVIILDDCSSDNSRSIINTYRTNPKIAHVIFNEVNSGSTFIQWNKGFELSKGEYIWIAESDDYCDYNFLETLVSLVIKNDFPVIVFTSSHLVDAENRYLKKICSKGIKVYNGVDFIKKKMTQGNAILNASSAIFSKNALTQIKNDYTTFKAGGDRLFWIYLAEKGKVVYCKYAMNYFRQHTLKVTPNAVKTGIAFFESARIYDYLKSHNYINGFREYLIHGYYMWLISHVKGYKNIDVKNKVYNLWKAKSTHPYINKILFLMYYALKKVGTKIHIA